jgi:hypothetical protein
VLISPQQLVDRWRHPRSRADELASLRARHRAQPPRRATSPTKREAADRMRVVRRQLSDALAEVSACRTCAKGHPEPEGRWSGGHCCGGNTLQIFSAAEVASLKAAGTKTGDWTPPDSAHAGCAFRGPTGCSLEPEDRPSICLRYICLDLRRELLERGDGRAILALASELAQLMDAFGDADQGSTSMPRSFHR